MKAKILCQAYCHSYNNSKRLKSVQIVPTRNWKWDAIACCIVVLGRGWRGDGQTWECFKLFNYLERKRSTNSWSYEKVLFYTLCVNKCPIYPRTSLNCLFHKGSVSGSQRV